MSQRMEVERFAFVILRVEEVTLLAVGKLFRITPNFIEPRLASIIQIGAEHFRHLVIRRQREHRRLGGFRSDVSPQTTGQVREDVLPGFLPILGRTRLAGDVRLVGREIEPSTGQAAKFVSSLLKKPSLA